MTGEGRVIKTRFAPSPTGYLHIGGARTALFSWAWAKKHGGQFFLRIEDTDAARSQQQHSDAIIAALNWLGLTPDEPPVYQSQQIANHQQAIAQLLESGHAYHCYCTHEELETMRAEQTARGESPRYDRRWRDSSKPPPPNRDAAVRFKMPLNGHTTFDDLIKGTLSVANDELDDFIIARADGMPTYNLAAVVDDINMGITHIIRGDDHVMNTYRQWHVFNALCAANKTAMPQFAHMPMILSAAYDDDGKPQTDEAGNPRYTRMSKRNAAVDIDLYRQQGFLPEALCNYLSRLSWSHNDIEFFTREVFVRHFELNAISESPARFDWDKLRWLNREHLQTLNIDALRAHAKVCDIAIDNLSDEVLTLIQPRISTLADIASEAAYFVAAPAPAAELLAQHLTEADFAAYKDCYQQLAALESWNAAAIKQIIKAVTQKHNLPFKSLGMPLRVLLTGLSDSPDIARIAELLGQPETLRRLAPFK